MESRIKLQPIEYRVVVLMDEIDHKLGESGLLVKANFTETQDKRNMKKGTLIAISDCSFTNWDGTKPRVGDRVECAQYPGQSYVENEVEYRICNDLDIIGILKE